MGAGARCIAGVSVLRVGCVRSTRGTLLTGAGVLQRCCGTCGTVRVVGCAGVGVGVTVLAGSLRCQPVAGFDEVPVVGLVVSASIGVSVRVGRVVVGLAGFTCGRSTVRGCVPCEPRIIMGCPLRVLSTWRLGVSRRGFACGLDSLACGIGAAGLVASNLGLAGCSVRTVPPPVDCGLVTGLVSARVLPRVPIPEVLGAGRLIPVRSVSGADGVVVPDARPRFVPVRGTSRRDCCTIPGSSALTWAVGR